MSKIINYFFNLNRSIKLAILTISDFGILLFSFFISALLRLENILFFIEFNYLIFLIVSSSLSILTFLILGIYQNITRYISFESIKVFFIASISSGLIFFVISKNLNVYFPLSIPLIYILITFLGILGFRIFLRSMYFDQIQSNDNTLIYGAGNGGLRLLSSLGNNSLYNVVAFIDDNLEIKNKKISGLKVYHSSNIKKIIERNNIKTLLIAIPSASNKIRKTILQKIEDINIKVLSVPNIDSVLSGKLKFSDLNNISIEELLGRDPVPPISNLLSLNIKNKNVFVSGAGGSIGSEIARQVINQGPKSLILFDISEYSLYEIHNEINSLLTDLKYTTKVYAILGTVNNNKKLKKIFKKFEIDTIYHAAAYKHVPIIEENIVEGINNNVFGTKSIVESAIEENISSFILISTDKAVRPSSIMGATKRIAELVCQSNLNTNSKTQISIVRFGNVLDSSGSVIPLFKNQITNDKPITITHKDVTRYFMTIPEAAQLVIQAGAMSDGGNIYILDMGKPIKIANIAEKIIKLYGYTPTYNKEDFNQNKSNQVLITFTGLRRGEKLHEELFIDNDFKETEHPRIISSKEKILGKKEINLILNNIEESIENNDIENLKRILNHPSIELSLDHEINDLVWNDN